LLQTFNEHIINLHKIRNDARIGNNREIIDSNNALEQLHRDLRTGKQRLRESIISIRSELRLQKALDKGKYQEEVMERDVKLQQFKAKIDNEVGNCMAAVEKLRHDIFYSVSGFFFTSAAALLGYLRFFS
jgi:hypothetical protein